MTLIRVCGARERSMRCGEKAPLDDSLRSILSLWVFCEIERLGSDGKCAIRTTET